LPSNLRPTTGKSVHLVTRGHFRSRDKDGGHTIQSVTTRVTTHATRKLYGCVSYETGVIANRSCTLRE